MVDGDKLFVQVVFNIFVSGFNGLGGVIVDGNVFGYKIKIDKKGSIYLIMSVMGVGIFVQVSIILFYGSNNVIVDICFNFNFNCLILFGEILLFDKLNIFKGRFF